MARSIPACAGEAVRYPGFIHAVRVYPRVCGGSRRPHHAERQRNGLSPRVRGKLCGRRGFRNRRRSIPACAGEARPK